MMNIKQIIKEELNKVLKEQYYKQFSIDDINDMIDELYDFANELKSSTDNSTMYSDAADRSYWNGIIRAKNEDGDSLIKILEKYKS